MAVCDRRQGEGHGGEPIAEDVVLCIATDRAHIAGRMSRRLRSRGVAEGNPAGHRGARAGAEGGRDRRG
jgi:hypothetical protein